MSIRSVRKHIIKKWCKRLGLCSPVVQNRQHQVSIQRISQNALKVLQQLQQAGYAAYLVGGSVRDLLVGQEPKDFDVVTDASPEQVRRLFQRSRIIGRRFRLVHVYFRGEIIEVSTFRANSDSSSKISPMVTSLVTDQPAMLALDNTYGTIEEDAWRRDFTVNALYYNSGDGTVMDYTDGMRDLKQRMIRMIGEPVQRFHEDPLRLLRAIRLAAKLNFGIDSAIEQSLQELANLLYHVPSARILDEVMKLFFKGHAVATYQKLNEYGYFAILFPQTATAMVTFPQANYSQLIELALKTTDYRFNRNMSLNPGFLFSVFLWPALQLRLQQQAEHHPSFISRLRVAEHIVLSEQHTICLLSKRLRKMVCSIWVLQYYLLKPQRHRVRRILHHRYFRAAIDFLQFRVEAGEPFAETAKWWQNLRSADEITCAHIIAELKES